MNSNISLGGYFKKMKLKLLHNSDFTTKKFRTCIVCQEPILPKKLKKSFKITFGHMKKGVFIQTRPSQFAHLSCFEDFEIL